MHEEFGIMAVVEIRIKTGIGDALFADPLSWNASTRYLSRSSPSCMSAHISRNGGGRKKIFDLLELPSGGSSPTLQHTRGLGGSVPMLTQVQ